MISFRFLTAATLTLSAATAADGQLRFEAEDFSSPTGAWLKDKTAPDRWMLWSTDQDADKKWSGGIVLKSPEVEADRATPEEGAPPLHTVLTGIPKGEYNIQIKSGRVLAVSLDGKSWSPYTGGFLERRIAIGDGTFELWVDDRFATEKEEARGSSYYDCILLHPCAPMVAGVPNGDFELEADGLPVGWSFSAGEQAGKVLLDDADRHSGKQSVRVEISGETGWTLACSEPIPVKPGDELAISGWAKGTVELAAALQVEGWHEGKRVARLVGRAGVDGAAEWTQTKGRFPVPEPITELRLSLTGTGPADLRVDSLALVREAMVWPDAPKVQGWAKERVEEKLDRGVVAARIPEGVYVGWRLLKSDPVGVGFDLFRQASAGPWVKLTDEPVTQTTDFIDSQAPADAELTYKVTATSDNLAFPRHDHAGFARGRRRFVCEHPLAGRRDAILQSGSRRPRRRWTIRFRHQTAGEKHRSRRRVLESVARHLQDRGLLERRNLPLAAGPRLGDRAGHLVFALRSVRPDRRRQGRSGGEDRRGRPARRRRTGAVRPGMDGGVGWDERRGNRARPLAQPCRVWRVQSRSPQPDGHCLSRRKDTLSPGPARNLLPDESGCLPTSRRQAGTPLAIRQPSSARQLLGTGRTLHPRAGRGRRRARRGHAGQRHARRQRRSALDHRPGTSRFFLPRRCRPEPAGPGDFLRNRDPRREKRHVPGGRRHR